MMIWAEVNRGDVPSYPTVSSSFRPRDFPGILQPQTRVFHAYGSHNRNLSLDSKNFPPA